MHLRNVFLTLVALFLLFIFKPAPVSAITLEAERHSGIDRYQTAVAISKSGWAKSEVAVLATGLDFPDALGAAPLAKKYNAPILLSEKDNLPDGTKGELYRLGVKKVFIIGGSGVISENVEDILTKWMGITVTRVGGSDRFETSVDVAKEVGITKDIVLASGTDFADALSIAPIAAQKGMPILLMPKDYVPEPIANFLRDNQSKIEKTYLIGGDEEISSALDYQFFNPERIQGRDKYERNIAIINRFQKELDLSRVYVATGENFPDALAGTAAASLTASPVVLLNSEPTPATTEFIQNIQYSVKRLHILGGLGAVSKDMLSKLAVIDEVHYQGESEHFIFYSMDKDKSSLPDLTQRLESNYERIVSSLKATINHKITVEIYPDIDTFHRVEGRIDAANWSVGSGVNPQLLRMVSPLYTNGVHNYEEFMQIIVHEFVHVVEFNVNPKLFILPKWLSEGLAIYEANQFQKNQLNNLSIPSLKFLADTTDTPDWGNAGGYALSDTIIEYLINNYGYETVLQLLKTPDLEKVIGISDKEFELKWRGYLSERYGIKG